MTTVDADRIAALVRQRSGLSGHALQPSDVERFVATIRRLPDPPARVLDVGCGTGVLVDVIAEMGFDAFGLDTDEAVMAEMTQPHLVGSIADIRAGDRSYGGVILNEVLEHLPAGIYEAGLREVVRIAADWIVVTVPNSESLESASTRCPQCECIYSIHGHVRRFDPDDMPSLLPGFTLSRMSTVGPYKLRHRTVEWYLRRRLLGRWPAQPGATCPQCSYRQPEAGVPDGAVSGRFGRVARLAMSVPWHKWWIVARYERGSAA